MGVLAKNVLEGRIGSTGARCSGAARSGGLKQVGSGVGLGGRGGLYQVAKLQDLL